MVVCRFMSSCPNSFWVLISPIAMHSHTVLVLLEEMNFWPSCARSHPPLLPLPLLRYPFMAGFEGHKRVEARLFNYSFVFPLSRHFRFLTSMAFFLLFCNYTSKKKKKTRGFFLVFSLSSFGLWSAFSSVPACGSQRCTLQLIMVTSKI